MNKLITRNQIALSGEFAVLSQLALHGFDANLTLGNTKGVDILLSDATTKKMRRLEVKTHINNRVFKNARLGTVVGKWRMDKKHEEMTDENLFFCFVAIEEVSQNFEFYIVPSRVVAEYVKWSHSDWLSGDPRRKDTPMRSFDLGTREKLYDHPVPKAEDYRRNWELLR